MTDRFAR